MTPRKLAQLEVERQRSELTHLSRVTMLGELSGSLAHELNQPLTAILANAQAAERFLAQDGADLDEVRAILADIVEEDKRAGEVIRRLRVLLKKGEVERQPLPLSEVVGDALELMRSDLVNRGVTLTAELPPDLPPAVGDRVQIQQVVLNLVANACDAMEVLEPRSRRLEVRTEAVADGMSPRFGGGLRAGPSRGRGGARLRSLLHDEGARHGPRSRRLPHDRGRARGPARRGRQRGRGSHVLLHSSRRGPEPRVKPAGEMVYLVDDEPAVLKALARLLRSAGLESVTFGSPEEFLARIDPDAEGCVVLDIAMPGLDGLALQEALASRGVALPTLFLTGHGDIPQSVRAMKGGAVDFLTKPVDDAVFLAGRARSPGAGPRGTEPTARSPPASGPVSQP